MGERYKLSIDQILSSEIIEGSYCEINEKLVEDIYLNPHKYKALFDNTANLKILNYLEMCNRMDTTPYYSDFALVRKLDRDSFTGEFYQLNDEQFREVVKNFQYKTEKAHSNDGRIKIQELAMNVLSIHTQKGLYVLAYRKLQLDVKQRVLRPEEDIHICTQYIMGEQKESIRQYLDADEYDYRKNSVYKTFLACDSVSDEVLLHNHYRCNRRIIEFNNKKYYNSKLNVCSKSMESKPLVYVDVRNDNIYVKNTAPAEVEAIVSYARANKDKSIGIITPFVNQKKLIEDTLGANGLKNVSCGTVHAFQGDEKDVVLFSTVLTNQTQRGTYDWLKYNKELINVATSRAKDKLIVLADSKNLDRLKQNNTEDDLYELIQFVRNNGESHVTQKKVNSRALGVKPFSTATEEAFLENLNHALENIWLSQNKYSIQKEVAISQVFQDNVNYSDLFYSGRFDFVVYELAGNKQFPVLAIELDGKEHFTDEVVKNRDKKKNEICALHNLQIIRVENSYARRYNHIKEILMSYFGVRR